MASTTWALTQISRLLPLDEDSLKQIIDYSSSLSKDAAAEHLKEILGDSPQALEFISSFNARRETTKEVLLPVSASEVPRRQNKKKAPLNNLPPLRRPEDYGNTSGAYHKRDEEDYMPRNQRARKEVPLANTLALTSKPAAIQKPTSSSSTSTSPLPPSAAGSLISDLPNVRTTSRNPSRTSSPAPKTKIALSGGTPMHGASSSLTDLDFAIRALEVQTNPSLAPSAKDSAARRCDCMATRHPPLAAAPNCLSCGKIVCVKEGLGPCTFCEQPLLSAADINAMVHALKQERGRERMDANNSSQRRADVAQAPRPFQPPALNLPLSSSAKSDVQDSSLAKALQHRDKLLTYQSQNARRTHVIDEAADFETPSQGQSIWSSPVERAAQLKRQQKVLREQEWNAKPEYEKRRVVVSVDLVGGKVVRRMGNVEREKEKEESDGEVGEMGNDRRTVGASARIEGKGTGAFGRNPLLGSLIRPVWKEAKGKEREDGASETDKVNRPLTTETSWRRVQDDNDDNEAWILDGGIYGGREQDRILGAEEHAVG